MSRRNYLTVAILSLTWILSQPLPATARSQHGVEVFPYGTVGLRLAKPFEREDVERVLAEAIVLWQQRRGPQTGVLSMSS
jgi:hypothetical protein